MNQPVGLVKMLSHIGVDVLTVHLHQVMEKELGSKILYFYLARVNTAEVGTRAEQARHLATQPVSRRHLVVLIL